MGNWGKLLSPVAKINYVHVSSRNGVKMGFGYQYFCQAQPQIQLSWAELALNLKYPASGRPAGRPGLVPEKLPQKLKFDVQASFNPTRTTIKKKMGHLPPFFSHFVTKKSFCHIQSRHLTKKLFVRFDVLMDKM
jgi:hypothetical protein